MKICAVLLVLWYCVSIVGFDVHTCMGSGRAFVTTFAEGMTCADIHPDHHCGLSCHHVTSCCDETTSGCHRDPDCSCRHSQETSVASAECCTDSYQVIVLTGCRAEDDSHESDDYSCGFYPYICEHVQSAHESLKYKPSIHYQPDSRDIVPCDRRVAFGIWRI